MRAPPRYRTPFVGRRAERHAAQAALAPGRVVTLLGTGGVGKTRLASELGRWHKGPTVFVDAAAAREPEDLARALLRDLGSVAPPPQGVSLVKHAGAQLSASGVGLCVLDDLDRLAERAPPVLQELVQAAPQAAFLATSRVADTAPGHGTYPIVLEPVSRQEGITLYLGALAVPELVPGTEHERIGRIVERLGGLPLAIELAAGRSAVLSLEEIERRLAQPLELLRDPARTENRTSALARSVAASWELLPEDTARVLAQSSVFEASFDLDAARGVLRAEGEIEEHLRLLVSRFLLRVDADGRYAPYESVRAFAADRLRDSGEQQDTLDRHADYHAALANRLSSAQRDWDTFFHVSADLEAVIARGVAPGARAEASAAARLVANGAFVHLSARHETPALQAMFDRLLATDPPPEERLELLFNHAYFALGSAGYDAAERSLEEALALARALGNQQGILDAFLWMARSAVERRDFDRGRVLAAEAIPLARAAGDDGRLVSLLTGSASSCAIAHGRFDEALAFLDEALPLARRVGLSYIALVLSTRATVEMAQGRFDAAERTLAERRVHLGAHWTPNNRAKQFVLEVTLEGARGGPGSLARIRALMPEIGTNGTYRWPAACVHALCEALEPGPGTREAIATALDGLAQVPEARGVRGALVRCACALEGLPYPGPFDPENAPNGRAVLAKVELVQAVLSGALDPAEALAASAAIGPPSAVSRIVDRALAEAVRRAQERAATWTVARGGYSLLAPDGTRIDLSRRPGLAWIAAALAEAEGRALDTEALFAAGWPGEKARVEAKRNRVRVAISTLRQHGLPIGWIRGHGWFFEAPVRVDPEPGVVQQ